MKIRVTDHAVLRYLERVGGMNIQRLRQNMAERIAEARNPASPYVRLDGVTFVVREDGDAPIVTTCLSKTSARHPRRKRKGARK